MNRRTAIRRLATVFLSMASFAHGQQAKKLWRIGYLSASSSAGQAQNIGNFRQGLGALEYVEGKNISIDFRFADDKLDRLAALAAELVSLKVDVIVTAGPIATRYAKEATTTLPIVMGFDSDPVGNGFIASLARPGGNITGLSSLSAELNGKRLEILKEIVPKISRVAVLGMSTNPGNEQAIKDIEIAAKVLRVKVQFLDIREPNDIESAFQAAKKGRAEGVIILNHPLFNTSYRPRFTGLAIKNRLPAMYFTSRVVEDDLGLVSYGASPADMFRRAAVYVNKILKGAKPGDIPVEQPMKFDLVINLKAAKQIGLTVPPNVLVRATRVIR